MAKRLHDTGLWTKQWFRILSPAEKCAFLYVLNSCDGAGVWDTDFDAAEFTIGGKVDWPALPAKTKDNIEVLPNGKWWVVDFVTFQCGCPVNELSTNRAHLAYVKQLKRHGLYEKYMEKCEIRGIDGPCVGHIEIDKELELDKEKDKKDYAEAVRLTPAQHATLTNRFGADYTKKAIDKLSSYKMAKGKTYRSDYHAILQWAMDAVGAKARASPKGWECPHCKAVNTHTGSVCLACKRDRDEEVT